MRIRYFGASPLALEMTRRTENIVARAYASERDRVGQTPAARVRWSGTFHAIANRLLRHHAEAVGLDPAFTVLDRSDAADLIDLQRNALYPFIHHDRVL